MKKLITSVFIAVALLLPGAGSAQEPATPRGASELEDMIVTSGRVPEERKFIVTNVTVIDEQEIRLSSADNVGDLLAQKAIGIVRKYPGNLTTIGIRGFRTDAHGNDLRGKVLVLLDGRRAGTGNVAKLMTKNVERIEIVRGPASVQYGSAAVGGVVNIITRQGRGDFTAFIEGRLGSFESREASTGFSGETGGFDYSASGTVKSDDDYTTADGVVYGNTGTDSVKNLSLNLGYSFLPNNRIGVIFNGFDVDEAGSPNYLSQNDLDDYTDKSNYSVDLVLDGQTTDERFIWLARYFNGQDEDLWADPTGSNPDGWDDGIPSERETDFQGAQAQLTARFGITQVTAGMDWSDYEIEATFTPMETAYENLAGFLMGKVKLVDDRLVLSAGLRYDTYEVDVIRPAGRTADDSELTPNVGVSFLLTDYLKLRAGYSQAFVMPGADQMAADYNAFGTNYVGNPDLSPETSQTYEAGIDFFYRSLSAGLTYFQTDFEDKIETTTLTNGDRSWENVGDAEISGFEANIGFDIGDFFGWDFEIRPYAGFTYLTEFKDKVTDEDLLFTHDVNGSYGISFSDFKGLNARLNVAYYGEKTITDFESGFPFQDIKAESFSVADFTISKVLLSSERRGRLTLDAAIDNLFNESFAFVKGYPMPERSFYLGLRYDF